MKLSPCLSSAPSCLGVAAQRGLRLDLNPGSGKTISVIPTRAQRYPFFGSFSDIWRSLHSAFSGYSIKGRSLIVRWWSPVRNHPVYVRDGQVPDWEESQVLAALAVSELSAALQ
jgi:hypothetical protein